MLDNSIEFTTMVDTWRCNNPVILLTRPEQGSINLAASLHARLPESRIVISPLIAIEFTPSHLDFSQYDNIIFTSVNAVRAVKTKESIKNRTCYAVGDKTAQAARELGFNPRSAQGNAADLIRLILNDNPSAPLLHLHGRHTRGDIAKTLCRNGILCHSKVVYEQKKLDLNVEAHSVIKEEIPLILPFFSPRTAHIFLEQTDIPEKSIILGMSKAVIDPLKQVNAVKKFVIDKPNAQNMVDAICAAYEGFELGIGTKRVH